MAIEKEIVLYEENFSSTSLDTLYEEKHLGYLDTKFSNNIERQSSFLLKDAPSNNEVISLVNDWQKTILFHEKDFNLEDYKMSITHKIGLQINNLFHSEKRNISHEVIPYTGSERVLDGDESAWDAPIQEPFKHNHSFSWQRKGSGRITACSPCSQTGYVMCKKCSGSGNIEAKCSNCSSTGTNRCSACGGSGSITREETETVHNRDYDRIGHSTITRTESCRKCGGDGKITCIKCSGKGIVSQHCTNCKASGKVKCSECDGNGRHFHYDLIKGKVTVYHFGLYILPFREINSKWLKNNNSKEPLTYSLDISSNENNHLQVLTNDQGVFLAEKRDAWLNLITKVEFSYKDEVRDIFIIDGDIQANETGYLRNQNEIFKWVAIAIGVIFVSVSVYYFAIH